MDAAMHDRGSRALNFIGSRLYAIAGYLDPPAVFANMYFLLPSFSSITSRLVTLGASTIELWSPNSNQTPFYPGLREPTFAGGKKLPANYRRSDGHIGRFDPTVSPQHYDSRVPWMGFIKRPCDHPSPEFTPITRYWDPSGPGNKGSFAVDFLYRMKERYKELQRMIASKSAIERLNAKIWADRPLGRPDAFLTVDGEISFDVAVDDMALIQAEIKFMDAWCRLADAVLKEPRLVSGPIQEAHDSLIGTWLNGAAKEDGLRLLQYRHFLPPLDTGARMRASPTVLARLNNTDYVAGLHPLPPPSSVIAVVTPDTQTPESSVSASGEILPPPVISPAAGTWTTWTVTNLDDGHYTECMEQIGTRRKNDIGRHRYFDRSRRRYLCFDDEVPIPEAYKADPAIFGLPVPPLPFVQRENNKDLAKRTASAWMYKTEKPARQDLQRVYTSAADQATITLKAQLISRFSADNERMDTTSDFVPKPAQSRPRTPSPLRSARASPVSQSPPYKRRAIDTSRTIGSSAFRSAPSAAPRYLTDHRPRTPPRAFRNDRYRSRVQHSSSRRRSPDEEYGRLAFRDHERDRRAYGSSSQQSYRPEPPSSRPRSRTPPRFRTPTPPAHRSPSPFSDYHGRSRSSLGKRRALSPRGKERAHSPDRHARPRSPTPPRVTLEERLAPEVSGRFVTPSAALVVTQTRSGGHTVVPTLASSSSAIVPYSPTLPEGSALETIQSVFPAVETAPVPVASVIGPGTQTAYLIIWNLPPAFTWRSIVQWILMVLPLAVNDAIAFRGVVSNRQITNQGIVVNCDFVERNEYAGANGRSADFWNGTSLSYDRDIDDEFSDLYCKPTLASLHTTSFTLSSSTSERPPLPSPAGHPATASLTRVTRPQDNELQHPYPQPGGSTLPASPPRFALPSPSQASGRSFASLPRSVSPTPRHPKSLEPKASQNGTLYNAYSRPPPAHQFIRLVSRMGILLEAADTWRHDRLTAVCPAGRRRAEISSNRSRTSSADRREGLQNEVRVDCEGGRTSEARTGDKTDRTTSPTCSAFILAPARGRPAPRPSDLVCVHRRHAERLTQRRQACSRGAAGFAKVFKEIERLDLDIGKAIAMVSRLNDWRLKSGTRFKATCSSISPLQLSTSKRNLVALCQYQSSTGRLCRPNFHHRRAASLPPGAHPSRGVSRPRTGAGRGRYTVRRQGKLWMVAAPVRKCHMNAAPSFTPHRAAAITIVFRTGRGRPDLPPWRPRISRRLSTSSRCGAWSLCGPTSPSSIVDSSCTPCREIAIAIVLRTGECREAVLIYHPARRSALRGATVMDGDSEDSVPLSTPDAIYGSSPQGAPPSRTNDDVGKGHESQRVRIGARDGATHRLRPRRVSSMTTSIPGARDGAAQPNVGWNGPSGTYEIAAGPKRRERLHGRARTLSHRLSAPDACAPPILVDVRDDSSPANGHSPPLLSTASFVDGGVSSKIASEWWSAPRIRWIAAWIGSARYAASRIAQRAPLPLRRWAAKAIAGSKRREIRGLANGIHDDAESTPCEARCSTTTRRVEYQAHPSEAPCSTTTPCVEYEAHPSAPREAYLDASGQVKHGAVVANYCEVINLHKDNNDKLNGAEVKDNLISEEWNVKAKGIINAAGPFTDTLLKMDDPDSKA
ncbi:hypothetical protein BJ912DRAFT_1123641 [Pholiota molesta]|nr:hypothetical protein BJ912DRAFT_1123641 [Pholiota molesta]